MNSYLLLHDPLTNLTNISIFQCEKIIFHKCTFPLNYKRLLFKLLCILEFAQYLSKEKRIFFVLNIKILKKRV